MKRTIPICCLGIVLTISCSAFARPTDASPNPPFRFLQELRFDKDTFTTAVCGTDGGLFVGSYDACRLIDLRLQRVVWEKRFSESRVSSDFLLQGDTLFAHVNGAFVTALDARTGKCFWEVPSPVFSHPLSVSEGLLYGQLDTHELVALNMQDGTRAWQISIPTRKLQGRIKEPFMIGAPIVCSNDVVLGLCDGRVMSLRRDGTGASWVYTLKDSETGISFIDDTLRIGDKVLIRSFSHILEHAQLDAFDLATGAARWNSNLDARAVVYSPPFCFVATGSNLVCLAAETGETVWSAHYKRQHEEKENASGIPVLRLHQGGVLLAHGANIFLFSQHGERVWDWTTRVAKSEWAPIAIGNTLAIIGRQSIVFFESGMPEPLPSERHARDALAQHIVARLESLTYEDERKLDILGAEAIPALVALFKRLTPTRDDQTNEDFERFFACKDYIQRYATAEQADLLAEVYCHDSSSGEFALDVLCQNGEQIKAALLALKTLQEQLAESPDKAYFSSRCMDLVTQVDHPELTAFLSNILKAGRPKGLLSDAYANVARNGTKEDIDLIVTLRKQAHHNPPLSAESWIAHREEMATIADTKQDRDGDGWPDGLELRLGTDPDRADTDGDGLIDSQDWNPLAPPRDDLTEDELVLQAAFDARFRYTNADELCVVTLPETSRPIEFFGRNWLTLCVAGPLSQDVADNIGKGTAQISFSQSPIVHWNSDKTEATVYIKTYFGPLAATGYAITIRRVGKHWIPIRSVMTWIS